MEHLGRGVAGSVDLVLAVIDPSYESIKLSEKFADMAHESKKPLRFILNRVEGNFAEKICAKIGAAKVVGVVAFSSDVQLKGLLGEPLNLQMPSINIVANYVIDSLKQRKA